MAGPKKSRAPREKRNLVRWNSDIDSQLLLTIQYACNNAGLRIPWKDIAEEMGELFSEGAIVQHLSKLRSKHKKTGIPCPPPLRRGSTQVPSQVYTFANTSIPNAGKGKKRAIKDEDSDTSDSDGNHEVSDLTDDEDGQYGSSRKRKTVKPKTKTKRQVAFPKRKRIKTEEGVEAEGEAEGEASSGQRLHGTRGIRKDYRQYEQFADDDDDNGNGLASLNDDNDLEEYVEDGIENQYEDDINDGEDAYVEYEEEQVSPRTISRGLPIKKPHQLRSDHMGFNTHGVPSYPYAAAGQNPYVLNSNVGSFSTNRDHSMGSFGMGIPSASSQSSFSDQTGNFRTGGKPLKHLPSDYSPNANPDVPMVNMAIANLTKEQIEYLQGSRMNDVPMGIPQYGYASPMANTPTGINKPPGYQPTMSNTPATTMSPAYMQKKKVEYRQRLQKEFAEKMRMIDTSMDNTQPGYGSNMPTTPTGTIQPAHMHNTPTDHMQHANLPYTPTRMTPNTQASDMPNTPVKNMSNPVVQDMSATPSMEQTTNHHLAMEDNNYGYSNDEDLQGVGEVHDPVPKKPASWDDMLDFDGGQGKSAMSDGENGEK